MNTDAKIYLVSNVYETILKYSGYTPTSEEEDMLLNAILARYNHMRHLIRSGAKMKLIESLVSDARPFISQFDHLVNPPTRCDTVFEHPCENRSKMDIDELRCDLKCVMPMLSTTKCVMPSFHVSQCAAPDTEPFVNVSVDFSKMQFDQVNDNQDVAPMVLDNDFDEDIY
jgi:hypothetical protein